MYKIYLRKKLYAIFLYIEVPRHSKGILTLLCIGIMYIIFSAQNQFKYYIKIKFTYNLEIYFHLWYKIVGEIYEEY